MDVPCTVRLLKVSQGKMDFYDYGEYEAMVSAAAAFTSRRT